jgi:hypothetical protein
MKIPGRIGVNFMVSAYRRLPWRIKKPCDVAVVIGGGMFHRMMIFNAS